MNKTDSEKLFVLADWFDRIQRRWLLRLILGWSRKTEVQDDLRRIARLLMKEND